MSEAAGGLDPSTRIEIWYQDEMRVGQKNGTVRPWNRKGTRPRQPQDQRYLSTYLSGAICPALDKGAALVLPKADTEMMQMQLDEIAKKILPGAHAVLIMDQAAWHTTENLAWPANQYLASAIAATFARARSGRECLAVPAAGLPIQSGIQDLRRHSRYLRGCLEQAGWRGRPHS